MDGAAIQAKIYAGYAKTASYIGAAHTQYRPASALAPLAAPLGTLAAHFRMDQAFARTQAYGKPLWMLYADGAQLAPGDYLVGAVATYFVAAMPPLLPIAAVQCNRQIVVTRPVSGGAAGAQGYGGEAGSETLLAGWPAAVLQGTKGERPDLGLPTDVRAPWWQMLLPAFAGVVLMASDIVADDLGRRYAVSSAELTDMGWRLTAQQLVT